MRKRSLSWIKVFFFGSALTMLTSCANDSNEATGQGEVAFEMTDAPIDDAEVKSVMVTVAEVRVDGKSLPNFTKQTFDLKAYQNGETKVLGSSTLDAKSYQNVVLVLDLETDANGNAPGCYVLTTDNTKYKLKSTASGVAEVAVNQTWKPVANFSNRLVMDFDLRKSIRYSEDPAVRYSFVGNENLNSSVRLALAKQSGKVEGTYQEDGQVDADKIIVYAYKKGTFNASTETQAQTADAIYFKNAVASAQVRNTLTGQAFTLAYLPEGEYELHFAGYKKDANTGKTNFSAMLESDTEVDGSVANTIMVKASASVSIKVKVFGGI